MVDKILFELLLLTSGDTIYLENEDSYNNFTMLIIELTKIKYNIRYFTKNKCCCLPEYKIEKLLSDEELMKFIKEFAYSTIVEEEVYGERLWYL